MGRSSWLLRPAGAGESVAADGSSQDHRPSGFALITYLLQVPFLAIGRSIELVRKPAPQPGDIISLRAVPASGLYWLASAGRSSREGTAVRVLVVSSKRPKTFRHAELEPHDEPIILSPTELRSAHPHFVWRGPTEFWNPKPYVLDH
jgi:hypothetical protein